MARGWLALCLPLFLLSLFSFCSLSITAPVETFERRAGDDKTALRILPLGASITWGLKSPSGNGYRKHLRDQLRYSGWKVDMVGSKSNGDMEDNDVEAHSGDVITEIQAAAATSVGYKPNVVLINAGTNDCRLEVDIPNTGARMRKMIEFLVNSEDMKDTLIVLSTLIPSAQKQAAAHRDNVNQQYRDLVKSMADEGVNIALADMDPPAPDPVHGWMVWPDDFTAENGDVDDTHPNDYGYAKMAAIWYDAIDKAYSNDLIHDAAVTSASAGGGSCEKSFGDGIYAGGLTQRGSGEDDGIYYHASESKGVQKWFWDPNDDLIEKIFFARLITPVKDELVTYEKQFDKTVYHLWTNLGEGNDPMFQVQKEHDFDVHDDCLPRGVQFIDINGDGLDDFVCIAKDGTAYASVNNGDGTKWKAPTFTRIGKWKDSEGDQAHVRLGDIDGDGRADYCIVADNGDIECWRNGWIDDVPKYWQPLGKRFTGKGMGDIAGVRFEDINGDGRDDWLWVDEDGATTTYTNSRSCIKGKEGDGLNIVWRQGFQKGKSSGPTHPGMSSFGKSGLRSHIFFARIYGEPQDFGLLGRQDYVFVERKEADNGHGYDYYFHMFKNVGSGATKIKSDGNRYCNMMGHGDGRMDYVWILSKGDMRIYPNKGMNDFSDSSSSYWGANYVIFDPAKLSIGMDLDRRDLHLVDWDGDGACDIVWTDPENNNKPHLWRNNIKKTGDFNWKYDANPAPDLKCSEKGGVGFFDRPVHLADITGSSMSDYLCVEKDGRVSGYIHNEDGSWEYMDQIKFAEGKDRANLHWADVNGDGRADMIHTNKFNGDGTVWYNRGRKDIGGSRFWWVNVGVKFQGAVEGSCTYFPDLNGDGLADMHAIIHSTKNTAKTWYNGCTGKNHVGDDGPIEDPDLPILPQEDGVIIHYKDDSCSRQQVQALYKEFTKARSMAREAQLHIQKDGYFNTFFAAENRDPSYASEVYGRISEMIGGNGGYHFEVTCNNKRESCKPSLKGDKNIAAMSTKGVMNICDAFLDHKDIKSTEEREKECGSMSVREAHHSRAAILLHESSHTSYAMTGQIRGGQPSLDYAYGYEASRDLALGKHDRSCWLYGQRDALRGKALCGPEIGDNFHSESVCNAKLSKNNADSYALVAAGLYFSAHCHKTIPAPPPSTNAAGSDSCPSYDYVQIDESPILGIDRYVHFGDSYAAGMGTGTTTSGTDKQGRCRIGSNNYGKLIDTWLDAEKLTYESHACSGDTTVGLDGQIDTWLHNDPKSTNIGTLTMGGNDVGFSDLVRNCIITWGWYDIDTYRKSCLEAESKALDYIHNSGDGGLGAKLRSAYKRIVNGANDNFHLHVPGYVGFFNHDTENCDHTTFYYWGPAWEEKQNPNKYVYLTRDLRKELNNLVGALNDLISATIAAANSELGSKRIHYVDMQSHFDSHRWCEADVREPDPNGNSFFFLAGWNDQGTNDIAVAGLSVTEADELQALADQGSIKLPDAATCRKSLGTDPDPYAEAMCHVAETVAHDPNGPEAQRLDRANKALANGDLSVQEISWYLPTRTIKMFHPRTPGMAIYRDAVIDSMKASGQFPWW